MTERSKKLEAFETKNRVRIGMPGLFSKAEFSMDGCIVCKDGGANVYNVDMISVDGSFTVVDTMPVCHECVCLSMNGDD
jgi:hypothetical protein